MARWSPYRIRRVHVNFIGPDAIYRPNLTLTGIEGTHSMYHLAGANTQKFNASTTTEGLEDDLKRVLKTGRGRGRLSAANNNTLTELKVVTVASGKWKGIGQEVEGAASGEEDIARKVVRDFYLKTRLTSCFCSSCQLFQYGECHISRTYPGLVPNERDGA